MSNRYAVLMDNPQAVEDFVRPFTAAFVIPGEPGARARVIGSGAWLRSIIDDSSLLLVIAFGMQLNIQSSFLTRVPMYYERPLTTFVADTAHP